MFDSAGWAGRLGPRHRLACCSTREFSSLPILAPRVREETLRTEKENTVNKSFSTRLPWSEKWLKARLVPPTKLTSPLGRQFFTPLGVSGG